MHIHDQLQLALNELEVRLDAAGLWQLDTPEAPAFASQEPFCIDTMSLPQWMRFVFIARLQALVDARAALPAKCDVTPALEAYIAQEKRPMAGQAALIGALRHVDQLVTNHA